MNIIFLDCWALINYHSSMTQTWNGTRKGAGNPNYKGEKRKSRKQISKEWYERNKDNPEFKRKAKEYRRKNQKHLSRMKALWKENNPVLNIWSNAKYRARRKGIDFNLSPSDIIIPKHCPYLGVLLTSKKLNGHRNSHMSLDRIDSKKGYIKGNVEVISYKANAMKQDATKEDLITFAKNILNRYGS